MAHARQADPRGPHPAPRLAGVLTAPTTTGDIVAKLWNLCNVLKDDEVTYDQYVSKLS